MVLKLKEFLKKLSEQKDWNAIQSRIELFVKLSKKINSLEEEKEPLRLFKYIVDSSVEVAPSEKESIIRDVIFFYESKLDIPADKKDQLLNDALNKTQAKAR